MHRAPPIPTEAPPAMHKAAQHEGGSYGGVGGGRARGQGQHRSMNCNRTKPSVSGCAQPAASPGAAGAGYSRVQGTEVPVQGGLCGEPGEAEGGTAAAQHCSFLGVWLVTSLGTWSAAGRGEHPSPAPSSLAELGGSATLSGCLVSPFTVPQPPGANTGTLGTHGGQGGMWLRAYTSTDESPQGCCALL